MHGKWKAIGIIFALDLWWLGHQTPLNITRNASMKHLRLHGYCWMHQGRQQHPKKKRLFHVLCCLHLSILPRINNNPSFNLSWIFEQLSNAISNRAGITVGILSIGKQEIHFIAIINHISFQKNKNWAKLLCS